MFRDREDAGRRLAERLKLLPLRNPLVLGIPRGGVVIGAVLARELGAELDVVLSRKLRAPWQPELALGAVCEDGEVYLDEAAEKAGLATPEHVEQERRIQLEEIARRRAMLRAVRPKAPVAGRSVIVTDDGIATGSTMIAALEVLRRQHPHRVVAAVPVAPPDRIEDVRRRCDDLVCLLTPTTFWAIGQFYEDFSQVSDATVLELLAAASVSAASANSGGMPPA